MAVVSLVAKEESGLELAYARQLGIGWDVEFGQCSLLENYRKYARCGHGGLTPLHIASGKDRSESVLNALIHHPEMDDVWGMDRKQQDKRAKGLCYRCDGKFGPGHRCSKKALQVLLVDEEEEEKKGGYDEEHAPP
ncbi:hypothetical protein Tco_1345829 [Tanacetum coccineum]